MAELTCASKKKENSWHFFGQNSCGSQFVQFHCRKRSRSKKEGVRIQRNFKEAFSDLDRGLFLPDHCREEELIHLYQHDLMDVFSSR